MFFNSILTMAALCHNVYVCTNLEGLNIITNLGYYVDVMMDINLLLIIITVIVCM